MASGRRTSDTSERRYADEIAVCQRVFSARLARPRPFTSKATTAEPPPDPAVVERILDESRKAWQAPGIAVAIVKDDRVHFFAKGQRELGSVREVTKDTLFPIGSCTKAFTATALAILVDEGKADWDDLVASTCPGSGSTIRWPIDMSGCAICSVIASAWPGTICSGIAPRGALRRAFAAWLSSNAAAPSARNTSTTTSPISPPDSSSRRRRQSPGMNLFASVCSGHCTWIVPSLPAARPKIAPTTPARTATMQAAKWQLFPGTMTTSKSAPRDRSRPARNDRANGYVFS